MVKKLPSSSKISDATKVPAKKKYVREPMNTLDSENLLPGTDTISTNENLSINGTYDQIKLGDDFNRLNPDATTVIPVINASIDEADSELTNGTVTRSNEHSEENIVHTPLVRSQMGNNELAEMSRNTFRHSSPISNNIADQPHTGELLEAAVRIKYIDPLSASKISAAVGATVGLIWILAVGTLYLLLDFFQVFNKLNTSFSGLGDTTGFSVISPLWVFLFALISGFLVAVLITVFSVLGTVIYNILSEIFGGILVTLADDPQSINE